MSIQDQDGPTIQETREKLGIIFFILIVLFAVSLIFVSARNQEKENQMVGPALITK